MEKVWISNGPEESEAIGRVIAALLPKNSILLFYGEVGAGKTTLLKGVISALTGTAPSEITSPTFTYLQTYEGRSADGLAPTVHHFDLYRIESKELFCALGFTDHLFSGKWCCIEWPEILFDDKASLIQRAHYKIELFHIDETRRKIVVTNG